MLNQNLSTAEIDSVILNLSIYCPVYCPNFGKVKNCILNEVQDLSLIHKTEWIGNLTENKKVMIFQKHKRCFVKNQKLTNNYL
ncbi:MAG: hypothetical protein KZQ83_09295 [gamma proteobacterium symbiont of Taylorina sp.]|nr:hypothetical protein [gamma proteobacterium symbiont of Taylorina sp.]